MLQIFYKDDGSLTGFDEVHADDMLELIRGGEWERLENMPVGTDANGIVTCRWKDDLWKNPLWIKGTEPHLTAFTTTNTEHLSRLFINEMKSVIYLLMYVARKPFALSTLSGYQKAYKKAARHLHECNIHTFGGLTDQIWRDYQQASTVSLADSPALNKLIVFEEHLPFRVQAGAPSPVKRKHSQYPVVPDRLYLKWGQDAEDVVNKWTDKQARFSVFISEQIELFEDAEQQVLAAIRSGKRSTAGVYTDNGGDVRLASFLAELEAHGIPLVDNNENPEWMRLFIKHDLWVDSDIIHRKLRFKGGNRSKTIPDRLLTFDDETFSSFDDLKQALNHIESHCMYLIFILSGMRSNEYFKLKAEYAAQTVSINGHVIPVFHTGQQKITVGYQAKKDVFVTSELGHKAYHLLNAIYEPFRNKMIGDDAGKRPFMVSFDFRNPSPPMQIAARLYCFTSKLTKEDIQHLQVSEHGSKKFKYKEGGDFRFSSHMGRRSLAYYLVALELCGFPQLKQQFSHLSMAMSIYYSNNASKRNGMTMYAEVEDEREIQLALALLRLKERAAQKDLSGGQGTAWNEKEHKVMPLEYYKKLLSDKTEFVTAVAPGLWCTNRSCCKTAQLSLAHDVSCNESIVEHTAWIEGRRATSISKLETLLAMNELTAQDVSKEMINIRAAEQMIEKHHGEGRIEPYAAPAIVSDMLFVEA
jgi:integrase